MEGGPAETGADEIGEFVVEALEGYQRLSVEVIEGSDTAEQAVKGLVGLHVAWTVEDPERARRVARHRNEVMAGPLGDRLAASNRVWIAGMKEWLDRSHASGEVPTRSFSLLHAVVFAPTQELSKLWLAGALNGDLADYEESLAGAAWAGVLSLEAG